MSRCLGRAAAIGLCLALAFASAVGAQTTTYAPYGGWIVTHEFATASAGIDFSVSPAGEIFVLRQSAIEVWSLDGQTLRTLPIPQGAIEDFHGVRFRAPDELIFCATALSGGHGAYRMRIDGTGVQQIAGALCHGVDSPIAIGASGRVALLGPCRYTVLAPDLSVEYVNTTLCDDGQITNIGGIGSILLDANDRVLLGIEGAHNTDVRIYAPGGTYLGKQPFAGMATHSRLMGYVGDQILTDGNDHPFYGGIGTLANGLIGSIRDPGPYQGSGSCRSSSPAFVVCTARAPGSRHFFVLRPGYRSPSSVLQSRQAPLVSVSSAAPRSGTTISDIDFVVRDGDSANVAVAALAFVGGVRSLTNAARLTTFVDGTSMNLGPSVPTNSTRRISWDAAADLPGAGTFVSAKVSVFARDDRGLFDLQFTTIPADIPQSGDPPLTISSAPIADSELLDLWFWLVASGDGAITFAGGEVRGNAGAFANQLLASGTTTTADGRTFLFERLGVRAATAAEIERAKQGTTPGIQQYQPYRAVKGIPVAVNEIGIDTGATSGHWVVPL